MDGSGARDGQGSPPWDPAEPVPDLEGQGKAQTGALPGLGAVRGPSGHGGYRRASAGRPASDTPASDTPASDIPVGDIPGGAPRGTPSNADGSAAGQRGSGPGGQQNRAGSANGARGTDGQNGGPGRRAGTAADRAWPTAKERARDAKARADGGDGQDAGGGDDGDDKGRDARGGKGSRSFWKELPVLIVIAIVLALLIKSFAVQAFYIPSSSMENTLNIGDRVLINKIVYHTRPIHRGDIVVFDGSDSWDAGNPKPSSTIFSKAVDELEGIVGITTDTSIYIKRVIGLPGDKVACCTSKGQVTVNGVPLTEGSYLYPGNVPSAQKFSVKVPARSLWVMGDHRGVSYDSRGHMGDPGGGAIPVTGVLGRAFVIIWPPSRWGVLNIPATFEQPKLNASAAAAGGSSSTLEAALDNGTPVRPAGSPLPVALGFAGAVPLTWLNRRLWLRRAARRQDQREHD